MSSTPASPAATTPSRAARPPNATLDQKYTATSGAIYLSGIQALVRLPRLQRQRDLAAGLNTAGFISGYRGSPLGGLDQQLWQAAPHLARHHLRFAPGVNEELAATAVWGSQTVDLIGPARYDGVFAMWYGKGPGVDRCGDVFKHMNHAGSARHGGVLLVAGDDHGAYSSTLPHQSDHLFAASMIPLLYPCNVQEYLDLGLHGWAMSRFSGCAVGFKALADTVESSASVDADPHRLRIVIPTDFAMPEGGLNARLSSDPLGLQARKQEALMQDYKIYAALAYARANQLNRTTIDSPHARLGIIASGKSYLDVLEALEELGIDQPMAARIGLRLFKVAMPWPLEPEGVRAFAQGLDEILVVEEKRQVVEYQLKEQLYNWRDDVRPRVIGKFDEQGEWVAPHGTWLLPAKADFSISQVARVIASRVKRLVTDPHTLALIGARLAFLDAKDAVLYQAVATPPRPAFYCAGCPHNSSTRVPDGSFALAGIGCHVMATAIYPDMNKLTTHMGGEGAPWIGQAPFSNVPHVFQNLGDGTYFHSGSLAVRAALAAGVNITYKILYNDAVAMTGGQPVDGMISVPMIARQMEAEGVRRIAVVTEDPARFTGPQALPPIASLHPRTELDAVQRQLREVEGVSVLIYDQTCAAEKRRRRKKGELPDPARRVFINEAVCEGCGDCGEQSNCTAILPKETELGRKREIDQSACNKDFSCTKGFCPSFVTVVGGSLRKSRSGQATAIDDASRASAGAGMHTGANAGVGMHTGAGSSANVTVRTGAGWGEDERSGARMGAGVRAATIVAPGANANANLGARATASTDAQFGALPAPQLPSAHGYNILVSGIGGTGVMTVGALLGMAAHLQGKGVSVLDMTGMSQKNGAVTSHIKFANNPADLRAQRIATGEADLVLGCDMLTAGAHDAIAKMRVGRTAAIINLHQQPPGAFTRQPDWEYPLAQVRGLIEATVASADFIDATSLATALIGDALATNLFMLGYAWQQGRIPLAEASLLRAIELNGVAVESNQRSFLWGRRAAVDRVQVERIANPGKAVVLHLPQRLDQLVASRAALLTDYQSAAYAARYRALVDRVRAAEQSLGLGTTLARAVALSYFKLMAYKDEYEVARLYTDGRFMADLAARFDGNYALRFHLAPPLLARKDADGRPVKTTFGPWMFHVFRLLARCKGLRGGHFDLFGYSLERRTERALIDEYRLMIEALLPTLSGANHARAVALANLPQQVRGFGHVKQKTIDHFRAEKTRLLAQSVAGAPAAIGAAHALDPAVDGGADSVSETERAHTHFSAKARTMNHPQDTP
jgi:indolepyruvate ferredoxin oxidoreductase